MYFSPFCLHLCFKEVAELLQALLEKHPQEITYIARDNDVFHQADEVDVVVWVATGRLVLLYLPTYNPELNPIEMLWRHFGERSLTANSF